MWQVALKEYLVIIVRAPSAERMTDRQNRVSATLRRNHTSTVNSANHQSNIGDVLMGEVVELVQPRNHLKSHKAD